MNFLHNLWNDTLGFSRETLFSIGNTHITLLRLAGLVFIAVLVWHLSALVRRAIMRLAEEETDPGVYLLSRISSYLVWIIGTIIGLNYLGFELASFAFLGGALGLGLGFGLQNILNNFVSGIIILFDKTIKVGDVVDLQSGVTGKVTEINLRYTRITTSDLMDILVPNSEFISGRVVNWTYGEAVRRLHMPFSVAYGTDKELVREAGIAAAIGLPGTLNTEERKPDVWLVNMGDNGLEFELVVWIGKDSLGRPNSTRTSYMWALETELRKRNIEIPFPQRDLYLKNSSIKVSVEK
ncbi:MAG: mechanosensitive ion channel [Sideroxydans sp.]|nr:mechanosensitive ion channel [Sideroxydans sp.]